MNKVVRDGKVAVLVSPGYGAGWSSWGEGDPFCPPLVHALERGASKEELETIADEIYPDSYNGGVVGDLVIHWLEEGTLFRITEYDGAESLETRDKMDWMVA